MIRIANAAGFLGDNVDAPRLLVENAEVDYLTLEYLAELTMSILAASRVKNPDAGFARDFVGVTQSLLPALKEQAQLRVVTNAGGVNPVACARAIGCVLGDEDLADQSIGVIHGDDILPILDQLQNDGCEFQNLETGQPLAELTNEVVVANAYLGAKPITNLLAQGARIIITGRVADASLTVGPAMHEFSWNWDDWDRLAAATVAGHLIECGAQVTGGYSTDWRKRDLTHVGYPIAELSEDGAIIVTKPNETGGVVNRQTVVEQLVYEIGDPAHYLTPDVDVDLTSVEVDDLGSDRVAVRGATGAAAPDNYKVSLAYRNGFTASGQLLVRGGDCVEKAIACAAMVVERVKRAGYELENHSVELLGAGASDEYTGEVVMRIAVSDARREAVERFTKEIAPLITSGPAGLAGYTSGRSPVRPVFAYWPCLVPKELIQPQVEVRTAREWADA